MKFRCVGSNLDLSLVFGNLMLLFDWVALSSERGHLIRCQLRSDGVKWIGGHVDGLVDGVGLPVPGIQ